MRVLLVVLVWICSLWAYQYNSFLLKTQIDLYPKILPFDKTLNQKVDDGVVDFAVVYEGVDRFTAQMIAKRLNEQYKMLENYTFKARGVNVWSYLADKRKYDAIYVLKLSKRNCARVAQDALSKGIVTFVYDIEDLKCGFLIGSDIEREVQIYLNKEALLKGKYDFVEDFYLMVRFVE